jgi:hypothetical protein
MSALEAALHYRACGLSVIPIPPDGTRKPKPWKEFQSRIATLDQIQQWFADGRQGVGIVGGAVSGGLEIIDLESEEIATKWRKQIFAQGGQKLFMSLTIVQTPKGFHVYFRSASPEGNKDLARRPATEEELIEKPKQKYYKLIETRGEGGFVLAPGSPAECHPRCMTYELAQGTFDSIPTLNQDEREFLIEAARSLNQWFKDPVDQQPIDCTPGPGDRTGDLFETKSTWRQILGPLGWKESTPGRWIRPGGSRDSAMEIVGGKYLWCFSSSVKELPFEVATNKFATYAFLNCGGDFSQARKLLAKEGYRKERQEQPKQEPRKQAKQEEEEPPKRQRIEAVSMVELMQMEFPPVRWVVEDLIPTGYTLLAGDPKVGKSWMVLDIAYSVSCGQKIFGGYHTDKSEVLYLALEEGTYRRVQSRLAQVFDAPSADLFLAKSLPGMNAGGMNALNQYLDEHPRCKLIIIDTLVRFLPIADAKSNAYQQEAYVHEKLFNLAQERGIAIIGVTHTRKMKSGDAFSNISGSTGVTATADVSMVLSRTRFEEGAATLEVTGREAEEARLAAEFSKETCRWTLKGDARQEARRKNLFDLVSRFDQDGAFTFTSAKDSMGISLAHAKRIVQELVNVGCIKRTGNKIGKAYEFTFTDKAVSMLMGG